MSGRERVRVGCRGVVHFRRPPFLLNSPMRLLPGGQVRSGWVQRTSAASSHHSSSLRIVGPCGFACMKAFIDPSDDQLVLVQKVFRRSRSSETARLPSARSLPRNSQRLNEERGEIEPRSNPNTGNGDDWHGFLPPDALAREVRRCGGHGSQNGSRPASRLVYRPPRRRGLPVRARCARRREPSNVKSRHGARIHRGMPRSTASRVSHVPTNRSKAR